MPDDVARLAARLCETPVALLMLLTEPSSRLVGHYGLDVADAFSQSFPFKLAVGANKTQSLCNTNTDSRSAEGSIVLAGRVYHSCARVSLQTPDGLTVGCLCVLDTAARKLNPEQIDSLKALSLLATKQLESGLQTRGSLFLASEPLPLKAPLAEEATFGAAVLDTIGALVVVYDASGRIVRFNRFCEKLSGYTAADVIGTFAWEKLIPREDASRYQQQLLRARHGECPLVF